MIHDYFTKVQNKLTEIHPLVKESNVDYRTVSPEMGLMKGKLVFIDDSILDFSG